MGNANEQPNLLTEILDAKSKEGVLAALNAMVARRPEPVKLDAPHRAEFVPMKHDFTVRRPSAKRGGPRKWRGMQF